MDSVGSATDVSLGEVVDKLWDVDIYGARSNAAWVLTVQAACCLKQCLLLVVAVAYLLEVCGTKFWVLFAHRNAWNSVSHGNYIYVFLDLTFYYLYTLLDGALLRRNLLGGRQTPDRQHK